MLITIIVIGCLNIVMTYIVGYMVTQLTINPEFLSAMKRIAKLEKALKEEIK